MLETVVIHAFVAFLQSRFEILKMYAEISCLFPGPVSLAFLIAVVSWMKDLVMENLNQT